MTTETEALRDLAQASDSLQWAGQVPFVIIPEGHKLMNMEEALGAPMRKRGAYMVADAESFVAQIGLLKDTEHTPIVYFDRTKATFRAVLNENLPNQAGWRDLTVTYPCPLSDEWLAWAGSDKKPMSQTEFAAFIENNLPDIANPPGAQMLEMALQFEAKKKVNFASGIRLDNGAIQLNYDEQVEGTSARGLIRVPQEFSLGIPVLRNGPGYQIDCRLRYRISDQGQLSLWYEMIRAQKVKDHAIGEVAEKIAADLGVKIINI